MKIMIIRHGEPDYSIDSLTPKGWREAELLSERMCKLKIDDFYVSPLGRARDTSKATLERMGRQAEVLPWLQEFYGRIMDPKTGEKQIPWDLMPGYWTNQPELYDKDHWTENSLYRMSDVKKVYEESVAGLDALLARYGYERDGGIYRCAHNDDKTIALFCHFGLGMVILSHLLGISPTVLWHGILLPTSSVTTLITEERAKGEVYFRCMQMGDTSHLYVADEPLSRAGLHCERYEDGKDTGAR